MIGLVDFVEDQIVQRNSWYIDDLLEKYMKERGIQNSEYERLHVAIVILITSKPEINYEETTGRFSVNAPYINQPIKDKLENIHSQITGHIIGSLISDNFSDFIEENDFNEIFKTFNIEILHIFNQYIKIILKDDELEYNIDIDKRSFTLKTHYILNPIPDSIIPYFEFLTDKNDYQFLRKCHLPLDYGIYLIFLKIQKLFIQKINNLTFKIDTFDQN